MRIIIEIDETARGAAPVVTTGSDVAPAADVGGALNAGAAPDDVADNGVSAAAAGGAAASAAISAGPAPEFD